MVWMEREGIRLAQLDICILSWVRIEAAGLSTGTRARIFVDQGAHLPLTNFSCIRQCRKMKGSTKPPSFTNEAGTKISTIPHPQTEICKSEVSRGDRPCSDETHVCFDDSLLLSY